MSGMLKTPTPQYVARCVAMFREEPRYAVADRTVASIFEQWPRNTVLEEVLAKVVLLNGLYSTSIYGTYVVAKHIVSLRIDSRLRLGDLRLVDDIAKITFGDKQRFNLSFASKYCSWHAPDRYQMYDSYVDCLLWAYRKRDSFARFQRQELRSYTRYMQIIDEFRMFYGLAEISRKELDQFLWIAGRELALAGT